MAKKREDNKNPEDPSVTSHFWDAHKPLWDKISTLLAGTEAMRAAGLEFMPQYERESKDNWEYPGLIATLWMLFRPSHCDEK